MSAEKPEIVALDAQMLRQQLGDFARLLRDCVHAGANIGFVLPFEEADARFFWEAKVLPALTGGSRALWAAVIDGRLAGTVQLDWGTPANQPHRAEVTKLMVHPDFRRRGIARHLMAHLERRVERLGRRLITLDTRTGDMAEPLYASLGFVTAGQIPDFCLDPRENRLWPTTLMYKRLPTERSHDGPI